MLHEPEVFQNVSSTNQLKLSYLTYDISNYIDVSLIKCVSFSVANIGCATDMNNFFKIYLTLPLFSILSK